MSDSLRPRLFLDSNILTGGLVARWGGDKAILSLCAAHACQLVLAEIVREEVERNLLKKVFAVGRDQEFADQLLADYDKFLQLAKPEIIPFPDKQVVLASRHLIRHAADVPVLVSAMEAKPDWLITNNTDHFTPAVAQKTGLRITTASGFFRSLVESSLKNQDED
ncbi:MAG: PIN domain-containing protein [Blastocatellia bacterium]